MSSPLLQGLRVLDLSRVLAGPWAAMTLGDLGADVVKVEQPGKGDDTRGWGPPFAENGMSAYYLCANKNKRGIALDLKSAEGGAVLAKLIAQADVLIENFRAGGLARLRFDEERLRDLRPNLVYCTVTGFGYDNPHSAEAGYDFMIQARSGLMGVTGEAEGEPTKVGVAVCDLQAGLNAANGILAALFANERARCRGERVSFHRIDIALFDSAVAMLANQASHFLVSGEAPRALGNAHPHIVPYQAFEANDGRFALAEEVRSRTQLCTPQKGEEYELNRVETHGLPSMKTLMHRPVVRSAAAVVLSSAPCLGQHLLREITGPLYPDADSGTSANGRFGAWTAFLGDIDGDGSDDVIIAEPLAKMWEYGEGRIYAYSVRTGELIWSVSGTEFNQQLGSGLAPLGRIDGDAVPDFLTTTFTTPFQSPSYFEIYSGADGSLLSTPSFEPFGFQGVTPVGDLDGDSFGDYLADYDTTRGQIIYVVSGFTNTPLRTHQYSPSDPELRRVVALGDSNFDGRGDYAITRRCPPSTCSGGFDVFSGADGSLLFSKTHSEPLFSMLTTVTPMGDFDGDGAADLQWRQTYFPAGSFADVVLYDTVVSGATGSELGSLPQNRPNFTNGAIGDLNGDGREEYLSRQGDALVVDPSDFSILERISRLPTDSNSFGRPIQAGGDANADGIPDFMFTINTVNGAGPLPGRVLIFSGDLNVASNSICFGDQSGCVGCPCGNNAVAGSGGGCLNSEQRSAQLFVHGSLKLSNDTMRFEVRRATSNSIALLVSAEGILSVNGSCSPDGGATDPLLGGLRCIGGNLRRHGARSSDENGAVGLATSGWGPPDEAPGTFLGTTGLGSGQTRYFQAFYRDSDSFSCGTGINTTNGVSVTARP